MACVRSRRRHIGHDLEVLADDLTHAGFALQRGDRRWRLRRDRVAVELRLQRDGLGYDLDLSLPTGCTRDGRRRCAAVRELLDAVLAASFNVRAEAVVDPRVSSGRMGPV